MMIFNLNRATVEAELLFTGACHKVTALSPLYEPTTPGTLLEAFLQHFLSQLGLFHFVYHFVISTACERMC